MKQKLAFSKILIIFLMAVTLGVIIYSMIEMHIKNDLSALPVLIGGTVTETIGCGIFYLKKSIAENTVGGITYDTAMVNEKNENEEGEMEKWQNG